MTTFFDLAWAMLMPHLPVLPVVIPLMGGALIMLIGETRRGPRATVSLITAALQVLTAGVLLQLADGALPMWPEGIAVYSIGGWQAPYGIVLVVDRLSALLLLLSAILGLAALVYSRLRWDRTGVHYHPLFQFLLMGLNGAFLTGDLFNLFVFFEILLAASYGLVLHGSGAPRVKAGLHYIVVNLTASFVFLIAAALVYGVVGTLNMADIAQRAATLDGGERTLFHTAMALLGLVFLVKAAVWPLNFWLVPAYTAAAAPVAAMFSIMTKVGIYAILRIGTLLGEHAPPPFAGDVLFYIGLVTMGYGLFGVLGAQQMERVVAFCIIVSAGVLLAAIGVGTTLTAALLFYLLSSALATGAFFMLIGITGRPRSYSAQMLALTHEAFGVEDPQDPRLPDEVIGIAIPGATAFLGVSFLACVLLVAGVPPLSGFVAKFAMIAAALDSAPDGETPITVWLLIAVLLASGLTCVIALSRIGISTFWAAAQNREVRLNAIEAVPVAVLVVLCVMMSFKAGHVMDYLTRTATELHDPQRYISAVLTPTGLRQSHGVAP